MSFQERLVRVRERIEGAASKSGRQAKDIFVVAVTKGVTTEKIDEARQAGISCFGENKVQEAQEKVDARPDLEWHMIGHLQSNKVADAVRLFNVIQSVDSVRLAEKISGEAVRQNKPMTVLLEVNVAQEEQKYGFKSEELYAAIESMTAMPQLKIAGLMGMAPNVADPEPRRQAFKKLKGLFGVCKSIKTENMQMRYLSMGMSDDFEIAVEEGANMVRLGRVLFK